MWEATIAGVDFYHIASWFFIYSFLGWLWETCYVSAKQGELVNRGFINGPFCTIYGFGALGVYLILKPVEGNTLWLFLGGIVVATTLEYITAVLMESIFHTSWWDYSDKKWNFQGRICLGASLGWGLFTLILFRILHPMVENIVAFYPIRAGQIGLVVITAGYTVDFCWSAAAAFRLRERIPAWEQALDELQGELLLKVRQKMEDAMAEPGMVTGALKKKFTDKLDDIAVLKELEKRRLVLMEEVSMELNKRKAAMAGKFGYSFRRLVKSYPNLNRGYRIHHKKKNEKEGLEG
ncbi:MAG: putative ABC transporter permease [Eubacteriales bacterium]|nr:putative ABC transporter permease [Eubacteriales bacterium]